MLAERAAARVGEEVLVLLEESGTREGRAAHQGPEVDGTTRFTDDGAQSVPVCGRKIYSWESSGIGWSRFDCTGSFRHLKCGS